MKREWISWEGNGYGGWFKCGIIEKLFIRQDNPNLFNFQK